MNVAVLVVEGLAVVALAVTGGTLIERITNKLVMAPSTNVKI